MLIQKMIEPFEHVVIDDVYTEDELALIWRELYFLRGKFEQPSETGSAIAEGITLKTNTALFIDGIYTDRKFSDILSVNRKVFGVTVLDALAELHPAYGVARWCDSDYTVLNYYGDNNYYHAHSDVSVFTFITFLVQQSLGYSGGNFLFPDFDYTIEQKNNRLVIFPGCIRHQVTEVKLKTPVSEGRFSMAQFLNLKGSK
jgi:hypothetical protein